MKLKLAECKDGKFEKFLELGKDFGYFGNYLLIGSEKLGASEKERNLKKDLDESCDYGDECIASSFYLVDKDEKDPLNRFDGLFNGRTYGDGRFVLVRELTRGEWHVCCGDYQDEFVWGDIDELSVSIKNLHENPELWEKVK